VKELLEVIFEPYTSALEVYVDKDFEFLEASPKFYLYCKDDIDTAKVFNEIQVIFDGYAHVYLTHYMRAPLLENKKLLWRKSVWLM
jgi:hypothetical protein